MSPDRRSDVVVIGAGIIGLSVAYEIARRGRRVIVVERERPGAGATDVAAGMLAPVAEAEATQPEMLELGLESRRRYPGFVARVEEDTGLDCGYAETGTLLVALDADHREAIGHHAREQARLGLDVREIDAARLRELEPRLSPRVVGGYELPDDHQVDPRRMARALAAGIEARGGVLVFPARVMGIDLEERTVELRSASARHTIVRTEAIVGAAGSWTAEELPGFGELPLRPVKGQVVRVTGEPLLSRVIRTPDVYLVPRADGELVIGASSEEQGFDDAPTVGPILELLTDAWRAAPDIRELALSETNVGFRPALRDHLPALGAVAEGLFVATGHYRHGILLAPVTAELMADRIVDGTIPELLEPFAPGRFRATAAESETEHGDAS